MAKMMCKLAGGIFSICTMAVAGCAGRATAPEPAEEVVEVKTQEVSAETGTVFAVSDTENEELAGARLVIPPDSLGADTTITLAFTSEAIMDAGDESAGQVAVFGPKGTVFKKGASLTLPYVLGAEQSVGELFLAVLEDDGSRSSLRVISTGDGFVTATINGFTRFQPGTGGHWSSCLADGDCHETPPCDCEAGEACVAGACCPDEDGNGNCDPGAPDPCEEITCAAGQMCLGGECTCPDILCTGSETFDPNTCTCGTRSACEGAVCPAGHKCIVDQQDNTARCVCPSGNAPDSSGNCQSTCNCGPDQFCGEMGACICADGSPIDEDGRCGASCVCSVGQICTASGACVCPDGTTMEDGACGTACECPEGSICSGLGNCVCPDGTTASDDGTCGSTCECPDELICAVDGSCVCPDGSSMDANGTCGEACICPEGLVCTASGACACPDGTIADADDHCGGECSCPDELVCTSSGACACPDGTLAHPDTGCGEYTCDCQDPLVCASNGDCLCPDGTTIDTGTGNCGSACSCAAGEVCNSVGDCVDPYVESTCTCTGENACCDGCFVINEGGSCTDGLFCNGVETCSGGTCGGSAGDPCTGGGECADTCDEAADNCNVAATTACTDDGNPCTDDECDGAGTCGHPNNTDPCDDSLFCNGADTCGGGTCSLHVGDPCAGGADCADVCDEGNDACDEPPETACTDDGEECTDDICNGQGTCTHPPIGGSCNDGLFCNGADTCNSGTCSDHAGDPCSQGVDCQDLCDEGNDSCNSPAGTACADDQDECTDDECNGQGVCGHPYNTAPCDLGGGPCEVAACSGGSCIPSMACPIFVDVNVSGGTGDGSSWANATADIHDGAALASANGNPRVFVAAGVYTLPPAGSGPILTMPAGVTFYGGFEGTEDTAEERPARSPNNETVLDGESTNGAAVVVGASNAGLDRFTVTRGANATSELGGGMVNSGVDNLTISDVDFVGNGVQGDNAFGGGMANQGATNVTLSNVTFTQNNAMAVLSDAQGGGLYHSGAGLVLSNVTFTQNSATGMSTANGAGGGMADLGPNSTLNTVSFVANTVMAADAFGGGLANMGSASNLTDVMFESNITMGGNCRGGGMYDVHTSVTPPNVVLTNVMFLGNAFPEANSGYGAGLYTSDSVLSLTNVVFGANNATTMGTSNGGAIYTDGTKSQVFISHSSFFQNIPSAIEQVQGATTVINSALFGNFGQDMVGSGFAVSHTCSEQTIAGTANQTLGAGDNPFVPAASGQLFLTQTGLCVNNGDNSAANTAYGTDAWRALATDIDGATEDATNVDMGSHSDPSDPWIKTFSADDVNVGWTTNAQAGGSCTVSWVGTDYAVPDPERANGSTAHSTGFYKGLSIVCSNADGDTIGANTTSLPMAIFSTSIPTTGVIPTQYTCDGADISPHLVWANLPVGTQSLAIIVDDPTANNWVHWVLYNLPPSATELAEDVSSLPAGTLEGRTDFDRNADGLGDIGYGGPCPPSDTHTYLFTVYALDGMLADLGNPTFGDLWTAMSGHIVGQAAVVGNYTYPGP